MASIVKVARRNGHAYKAIVRNRGMKTVTKTFPRRADAKAWAERMERNIDEARAHGNQALRRLSLKDLIDAYAEHLWVPKKGAY